MGEVPLYLGTSWKQNSEAASFPACAYAGPSKIQSSQLPPRHASTRRCAE